MARSHARPRRRVSPVWPSLTALTISAGIAGIFFAANQVLAQGMPAPLVYLRDVDATIIQDMRYAGADNFTGQPVPGYEAAECMLLRPAAEALARVQQDLLSRNLSIKVYDCYRPARAVRAFVAWAASGNGNHALKRFYPRLRKSQLIGLGYIAAQSGHSRGHAVDLTIVELPEKRNAAFDPSRTYGPCTGSLSARAPDSSVDMGTGFDCFDALSHTANGGVTPEQHRWRQRLVEALARHHFHNYSREWWHFTYGPAQSGPALDVPIRARNP